MNKKGIFKLAIILVVVIIAYILVTVSEKISQNALKKRINLTRVIEKISEVEVKYAGQHYRLFKEKGNWKVEKIDTKKQDICDTGKVKTFFSNLKGVEAIGVATEDPKQYFEFGTDDTGAVQLKLKPESGKPVVLYIGRSGPDYNSAFLRIKGDKRVYIARNITPYRVKRSFKYWRYRKIWQITEENLSSLEIKKKHKKAALYKKDGKWYKRLGRTEESVDTSFIKDVVTKLNNIMIDEYAAVPDPKFYELDKSQYTLTVNIGSEKYVLRFGKITNSRYATEINVKPKEIFLINTYRIDNLSRKLGLKIK